MKCSLEDRIKKAISKHGGKYTYDLSSFDGKRIDIICPIHGIFRQILANHVNSGHGCPKCALELSRKRKTQSTDEFISKAKKVHGDKYIYDKVAYKGPRNKVIITCPIHGDFEQAPYNHLTGYGCLKCARDRVKESKKEERKNRFIERSNNTHNGKYDYSKVEYDTRFSNVIITCPIHGDFRQRVDNHMYGKGCPICGKESMASKQTMTKEEFIIKAREIHGDTYDYSLLKFSKTHDFGDIICKKHGVFKQNLHNHLCGNGCPICANSEGSKMEKEMFDFVSSIDNTAEFRHKMGGTEIDIFIKSKNIGIEMDGLYWHGYEFKGSNFHLDKTNKLKTYGIRLIHIFEDEYNDKKDIVKSRIMNILGKTPNILYARKTKIIMIDNKTSSLFMEENHIQGNCASSVRIALLYNNEIVSVMTFSKPRLNVRGEKKEGVYELVRFCNKINYTVIGGASKLLSFFIKEFNPVKIISYADKRWSDGNLYKKLGFDLVSESKPSYFYVKGLKRFNRFNFRKDVLVKNGGDPKLSENEIMLDMGYKRIYDCGSMKFEKCLS